jgi:glycosyltransferase involved in cell wall biosynthesis/4-amino-4-deoxy-L-arabinose transferase-like glycosyltransferase
VKVAYFSPLPPSTSGIADYSALLVPALERLVEVEVVRPGRTRPVAGADVALYHVGNDPDAHAWIVDALRRRPGVVVMHDFVIHHLVAGMTMGRHDGHAYLAAMEREAGVAGRMLGWGVLEGRVPPLWEIRPTEFPLAGEVLDRATGVIAHSRYVEERAREHGYDGPLWRIPHPAWPAPDVEAAPVEGAPLFGCFGHLNESKRIPQLLRAFAEFRASHPAARLLLVGAEAPGFDLAGRLERLGLDPAGVIREPYVEEERLWALMRASDACVLLRAPTMGETSGSAIRTLSLGKPLVVSDLGWFAELPDGVALKVPVGGDEEVGALVAALERLAEPGVASRMGEAALAHVRAEHGLERVAERYVAALEEAAGAPAVEAKVIRAVAEAAAATGVEADALAPELARLGLVSPNGHAPGTVPGTGPLGTGLLGTGLLEIWPMWLWLCSLYVVAVAVQLALGLRVVSPWIMVDELVYSDMARSFADTGHFLIRGAHANYGFVYPLLLSPAYALFGSVTDVYEYARVLNALAMCSVVLPTYLLARRVVRPGAALAAAAFAVAIPPMIYAGTLMTENVFYPVFAWLAYALVLALERPTLKRQLVLLALLALAFLTRAQAVALVAAALTAPLALAWIERGRPRRLAAWKATYAIVGAAALVVVVVEVARGRSPAQVLGGYSVTTTHGSYHVWPALRWIVYHLAALDLSLFVLPFAALIVLVASARHLDRALRVFAAAAATLTVWLVLEVGVFASQWSQRIEERNLFYLAPLFVIALLSWIERGQPRPARATVAAAGLAAALPGTIPFLRLMNINAQSDTPFLYPWWYLGDAVAGRANVALLAVAASAALAAAFLWLPRRYAPLLPAAVALGLFLTWLPLQLWTHSFARLSSASYSTGVTADRSWIDHAVGRDADVTIVWTGENPYRGWENEFWNRSVRHAYDLGSTPLIAGGDETRLTVQQSTGILLDAKGRPIRADYVLADTTAQIAGTPIAADQGRQMTLYRVDGPVRTATVIDGWHGDLWTGPTFDWTRRACTRGVLRVPVRSDPVLFAGITQRIAVSGTTTPFTVSLRSNRATTIAVPLVPSGGVCHVRFDVSPTRRPSAYPVLNNPDSRRLGVLVTGFQYVPSGA